MASLPAQLHDACEGEGAAGIAFVHGFACALDADSARARRGLHDVPHSVNLALEAFCARLFS